MIQWKLSFIRARMRIPNTRFCCEAKTRWWVRHTVICKQSTTIQKRTASWLNEKLRAAKTISTGFLFCVICERFFEWQLCASEKEWAVSTQRDTIRHFVALVFIATMKKAHTLAEWASEWAKRKSVITFFLSPQLNARVYCDSLIPFLRGATTYRHA